MNQNNKQQKNDSFLSALGWSSFVSLALSPFLFIAPIFAGYLGGKKAKDTPWKAIAAVAIPAAIWWGVFVYLSTFQVKGTTLGILTFLGPITALGLFGGALLGIKGKGYNIAGIFLVGIGIGYIIPRAQAIDAIMQIMRPVKVQKTSSSTASCPKDLKKLYDAMMNYAQSWDDTLPPANSWGSAITDPMQAFADSSMLKCPNATQYGYAMNSAVGGKRLESIKNKATTPLLYDSSDLKLNANDDVKSLPVPGRHDGQNYIIYMDGHVDAKP